MRGVVLEALVKSLGGSKGNTTIPEHGSTEAVLGALVTVGVVGHVY